MRRALTLLLQLITAHVPRTPTEQLPLNEQHRRTLDCVAKNRRIGVGAAAHDLAVSEEKARELLEQLTAIGKLHRRTSPRNVISYQLAA